MAVLIRVLGVAGCEMDLSQERWVRSYDLEAHQGRGEVEVTDERERALRFDTLFAALEAYRASSRTVPRRPDGLPNRPLTAYNVEFVPE